MVKDAPAPVERTGADPVTPDALKSRVEEVFSGINLTEPGLLPRFFDQGFLRITVSDSTPISEQISLLSPVPLVNAEARANGFLIASYFDANPRGVAGDEEVKMWIVRGEDSRGNVIQAFYSSGDKRVQITREVREVVSLSNSKTDERRERVRTDEVKKTSKRIEIAQILGIRV